MAAIRMLFSCLTEKGVLAMNPAREVQTERFSRLNGKTPAFHEGEVATLLAAIDSSTPVGLRDRALLATLAYTFARISAVIGLTVADYFPSGKRWMIRFREKGGKEKELPVHHQLEQVLDDYLLKTKLSEEPEAPLFPAARAGLLSRRPINRVDAAEMIKRPLRQAGLPEHYSAHSFRAAGVTNFLENGGSLEVSLATPTAAPQNFTIAAPRSYSSRTWSAFDTECFQPWLTNRLSDLLGEYDFSEDKLQDPRLAADRQDKPIGVQEQQNGTVTHLGCRDSSGMRAVGAGQREHERRFPPLAR
jgi:hypothetical protein